MDNASLSEKQIPGRAALWLGLALGLLAPLLYVGQLRLEWLAAPWYMPILGTVAAALGAYALLHRRGIVRFLVALGLVLLAGLEWSVFWTTKLPPYSGPVAVGQPFPSFTTTLADGTQFTQADLAGPQATAMVFFRGRW